MMAVVSTCLGTYQLPTCPSLGGVIIVTGAASELAPREWLTLWYVAAHEGPLDDAPLRPPPPRLVLVEPSASVTSQFLGGSKQRASSLRFTCARPDIHTATRAEKGILVLLLLLPPCEGAWPAATTAKTVGSRATPRARCTSVAMWSPHPKACSHPSRPSWWFRPLAEDRRDQ